MTYSFYVINGPLHKISSPDCLGRLPRKSRSHFFYVLAPQNDAKCQDDGFYYALGLFHVFCYSSFVPRAYFCSGCLKYLDRYHFLNVQSSERKRFSIYKEQYYFFCILLFWLFVALQKELRHFQINDGKEFHQNFSFTKVKRWPDGIFQYMKILNFQDHLS